MWPDRVSNPGPPTYESGALPIALRGPAKNVWKKSKGHNLETKEGGSFMFATRRPDLIHIPINVHEEILNGY